MKTIKFYTLGCKVNQYDSQSIRERFLARGFKEALTDSRADYFLINTCSVTAKADQKSRHMIRGCINANPSGKIIVTGCLAEKDTLALSAVKGIDYVISKTFFPDGIKSFCGHKRAFLKVQDGCDNFCSYCKVPLVRGRSRSRTVNAVVKETKLLVKSGHKEIVLTGICLGNYGKDLKPKLSLVDLLKKIEAIRGLYRIRLSSIEAKDVTGNLIAWIGRSKKVCRHLHIPVQSGDDQVLKLMQRRDSSRSYSQIIKNIRDTIKGVSITTDVIVGFPGETDQAFKHTLELLKSIQPLRVHVFPYSPRSGTKAFSMVVKDAPEKIRDRIRTVQNLVHTLSRKYLHHLLGKQVEVLFEARSNKYPGFYEGYTDSYIKVFSKALKAKNNEIAILKVKKVMGNALLAD